MLRKFRDVKAQLYDVLSNVKETNMQLDPGIVFIGARKCKIVFSKATEATFAFHNVFLGVGKSTTQLYNDFLKKALAERPLWATTGTHRDRIGTKIPRAGVRSLPVL